MSQTYNQDLFPRFEGRALSEEASSNADDALKFSTAHACFEINRLLLQLKECASDKSREGEKAKLLNDLEKAQNRRDNLLDQLYDEGIEVEMEVEDLRVSNLVFKTVLRDENLLPTDDIGHSFDITIPVIQDEQAMNEHLRKKLAPLRAENRSISNTVKDAEFDS